MFDRVFISAGVAFNTFSSSNVFIRDVTVDSFVR